MGQVMPHRLQGVTVAVTADRRRDEQAVLLERLGLEVLMFPLLRTKAEDTGWLRDLSEEICRRPPTIPGQHRVWMRTWLELAAQWGLQEPLVQALGQGPTIAARCQGAGRLEGRPGRVVQGSGRNAR